MKEFNSTNKSDLWDDLLNNNKYLSDLPNITLQRVKFALKQVSRNERVINIGSGQAYLENEYFYGGKKNIDWVSFDISGIGLKKIKNKNYNGNYQILGNVLSLPFLDNVFDTIICMEVIEHVHKSVCNQVYKELLRIGKNSTKYILSVPIFENNSLVDHPVGHMRKYTPDIFLNELTQYGFSVIEAKCLYAFNKKVKLLSYISDIFSFRRPNVLAVLCRK